MAKGRAITEFSAKQEYMRKVSDALKHCPYKVTHPFSCKERVELLSVLPDGSVHFYHDAFRFTTATG